MRILKDSSIMTKVRALSNIRAQTGGARVVAESSQKDYEVSFFSGNETVQLNCVLHLPKITHNLLSVSCLYDADHIVLFTEDKCVMKKGNKVAAHGKRDDGIYSIE